MPKNNWFRIGRIRITFKPLWRNNPHPYPRVLHRKYKEAGMRRFANRAFILDIFPKQ